MSSSMRYIQRLLSSPPHRLGSPPLVRVRWMATPPQPNLHPSRLHFHTSPPSLGNGNILDGPTGAAPQLPVVTTNDPRVIEQWLDEHVGSNDSSDTTTILGFDSESIAKPPWMPERASLPDGPATIQLSTPASCIIVQLSICGDGSALYAPDVLRRRVINNPKIIKVGVGLDDDALGMYRWSKKSFEGAIEEGLRNSQLWEMTSRFDLGCILPNQNPAHPLGIRTLAQKFLGVELNKSKKLIMSNWGERHLTPAQICYAALDAWVSAAILERLQKGNMDVFTADALMEMEFMKNQRTVNDLNERANARKAAKLELKEIRKLHRADQPLEFMKNQRTVDYMNEMARSRKAATLELKEVLELNRADQPPIFDEGVVRLTLL